LRFGVSDSERWHEKKRKKKREKKHEKRELSQEVVGFRGSGLGFRRFRSGV